MDIEKIKKLLEDFANPKKWELLGGHYYRCRSKSDARKNRWPHEIVQEAILEIDKQTDALRAIWPFIEDDFPKGLGDDHGTCATLDYLAAARKVSNALGI